MTTPGRDRDPAGRPRSARPRDAFGRPLSREQAGEPRIPDDLSLSPGEAITLAQKALWTTLRIVAEPGGAAALAESCGTGTKPNPESAWASWYAAAIPPSRSAVPEAPRNSTRGFEGSERDPERMPARHSDGSRSDR